MSLNQTTFPNKESVIYWKNQQVVTSTFTSRYVHVFVNLEYFFLYYIKHKILIFFLFPIF